MFQRAAGAKLPGHGRHGSAASGLAARGDAAMIERVVVFAGWVRDRYPQRARREDMFP
jgi:hypothetical protein